MGIIAKGFGIALTWLYSLIGNYAVCLIILTVVIKIAMYPVFAKQMSSSADMARIQPKVKEIQNRYAGNRELMNQKLSELYRKEGVSTNPGCVPMLLQMLVVVGLFTLLRNPMAYLDSNMLIAVHESFLWITDLAQPDKWILPVASGIATYFSMANTSTGAATGFDMTKVMKFVFPVLILWLARTYPAGLAIYWFISQLMQIIYNLMFAKKKKLTEAEAIAKQRAEAKEKERRRERAKARAKERQKANA